VRDDDECAARAQRASRLSQRAERLAAAGGSAKEGIEGRFVQDQVDGLVGERERAHVADEWREGGVLCVAGAKYSDGHWGEVEECDVGVAERAERGAGVRYAAADDKRAGVEAEWRGDQSACDE
jgi:hypothetical protein